MPFSPTTAPTIGASPVKALHLRRSIEKLSARTAPRGIDRRTTVQRELNILALIKGNERYVYVYDDDSRLSLIDAFRDQAADPRVSFS